MLMNDAESRMNRGDEAHCRFLDASQSAIQICLKDVEGNAMGCHQWSKMNVGP